MYSGEASNVKLRATNSLADPIIDAFGKNILLRKEDEGHFTVNVRVEVSPTFFAWVATFKDKIEILEPSAIRKQMKEFAASIYRLYKE